MRSAIPFHTLPPEEALHSMVRALTNRWRLFIMLPMIYLAVGLMIQEFWLTEGLLPVPAAGYFVLLFLAGFLVIVLWRLLPVMERRQLAELVELRQEPEKFFRRAREQQLLRFSVCDIAAAPGIVLFLMQADPVPLLIFCFVSMTFYLRAHPSELRLGKAYLRPDLL